MTDLLAPPDAEAAAVYLCGQTDSECGTEAPKPLPALFTRITLAGGSEDNLIQGSPRLIVECWGPAGDDGTQAYGLARKQWAKFRAAANTFIAPGVWCGRMQLTHPVSLYDTDAARSHYQFIAQPTLSLTEVSA